MGQAQVLALLQTAGAEVMAFDPSGAALLPLPVEFAGMAIERTDVVTPLDPLAPTSHGRAVGLFELARRNGTAEGVVLLADGETHAHLHLFDLSESRGVFLAVLIETSHLESNEGGHGPVLPPRRITMSLSPTGVVQAIDEAFTRALGWTASDVVGTSSLDLSHPEDHERGITTWAELLDDPGGARRLRQRMRRTDGSWLWVESTNHNYLAEEEKCVFSEIVDITDEMEAVAVLHRREALLARLTEALPTGVLHVGADGGVLFSNARWFEITGLPHGAGPDELFAILSNAVVGRAALQASLSKGDEFDFDVSMKHDDDTVRYGRLRLGPLDGADLRDGVLLAIEDTTEARLLHDQLADKARRDPLTGLLNRAGILSRLDNALEGQPTAGQSVAVLYLDLDKFKLINDDHSHSLGDAVLCAVAERLTELLRPGDHLGRVGGDEFLMVLSEVSRADDAHTIARRLESAVTDLSMRWKGQICVEVSIGVALARAGEDRDSVVNRADATMYDRKATRAASRRGAHTSTGATTSNPSSTAAGI